jgi:hypothetical protein
VLRHAEALLTSTSPGVTAYIDADLRDPAKILAEAGKTLDFAQPVAVMLLAVLHFVSDEHNPEGIVDTLMDAVPADSYLVLSHTAKDILPEQMETFVQVMNQGLASPAVHRTRDEVARFFSGRELLEPGLVTISEWRPDPAADTPEPTVLWCGVARKNLSALP